MLAAIACAATAASLWAARPSLALGYVETFLLFAAPAFCGTVCIGTRGYRRAFWFGLTTSTVLSEFFFFALLFPASNYQFRLIGLPVGPIMVIAESFRFFVLFWSMSPLVGLSCLLAHRFFAERSAE